MSNSNILFAAIEAFKQKFNDICQNLDSSFDKLNEETFCLMTTALMESSRSAGIAGLEQYLKENDTPQATIKMDI